MSDRDSQPAHARTLTSLLASTRSDPTDLTDSSALGERAHSVPAAATVAPSTAALISEALVDTHGEAMRAHKSAGSQLSSIDLKSFDPLSAISPPRELPPIDESPNPVDEGTTTTTTMDISIGRDQTISSISSYSSSALSSGSFTAISVSPIPASGGGGGGGSLDGVSTQSSNNNNTMIGVTTSIYPIDTSIYTTTAASSTGTQQLVQVSITPEQPEEMQPTQTATTEVNPSPSTRLRVRFDTSNGNVIESSSSIIANEDVENESSTSSFSAPTVAIPDILSPSYPVDTSDPPSQLGSPLPPVVSALMAAQKAAGTTPGTTLAMPNTSHSGRLIMLAGDASGAGKSSVALGLLHLLLRRGYEPKELAYIKPCTQCEDIQLVAKYCEAMGIQHQSIGPVVFYEGFTAEVIDGKAESVEKRRGRILKAVNKIAEGKKWVLVDGVGYAAVGSVAGVSNAEVASLLNAPVLVVGRPGLGNAIDSMNFIVAYFEKYHVRTLGACWNKVPPMHTYHSYQMCKTYVTKYFRQVRPGIISTYGHIPLITIKTDLEMTPEESIFIDEYLSAFEEEFEIELFLTDLNKYYQAHRVQLVSVV